MIDVLLKDFALPFIVFTNCFHLRIFTFYKKRWDVLKCAWKLIQNLTLFEQNIQWWIYYIYKVLTFKYLITLNLWLKYISMPRIISLIVESSFFKHMLSILCLLSFQCFSFKTFYCVFIWTLTLKRINACWKMTIRLLKYLWISLIVLLFHSSRFCFLLSASKYFNTFGCHKQMSRYAKKLNAEKRTFSACDYHYFKWEERLISE
jgi:hypothetical protein